MAVTPMAFRWSGDGMVPLRPAAAARMYRPEVVYWLVEASLVEASGASRRHMFAVLNHAWQNLPEDLKETYPTMDALRKRALIQTGHFDETMIEVGDSATAGRIVTSLRRQNDVSHVRIQDNHVFQRVAKSMKDMDKEAFEQAKQDIFEVIAELLGITVDELTKQGD